MQQVDKTVIGTLRNLAIGLAEKIIRTEIYQQPELMVKQLEQAMDVLSDTSVDVSVSMNPLDAQSISALLVGDQLSYKNLNIVEDENIERGDCCLNTPISSVQSKITEKLEQMSEQLHLLAEAEALT